MISLQMCHEVFVCTISRLDRAKLRKFLGFFLVFCPHSIVCVMERRISIKKPNEEKMGKNVHFVGKRENFDELNRHFLYFVKN